MSVKRQGAKAVEMNGKLFVVGGFDDRRYHKSGEFYNPDTDCWERQPDMNLSGADFSFTVMNGQLFAAGGTPGGPSSQTEYFNKFTNTWIWAGEMPSPKCRFPMISVPIEILAKKECFNISSWVINKNWA